MDMKMEMCGNQSFAAESTTNKHTVIEELLEVVISIGPFGS
jgi:hypothetical protein